MSHFVTTEWLHSQLGAPDLIILDASWYLPAQNRDAVKDYQDGHIPQARRFDLDQVSDHSSPLPHMLPSPENFAQAMGALGISRDSRIVIYDGLGLFSSARVWWTFQRFGHPFVKVLQGGAPKWRKENKPWTTELPKITPATYPVPAKPEGVASLDDMKGWSENKNMQLVDARAADRFRGEAPEPRAGLASGHIPNSRNLPFGLLLTDGILKDEQAIKQAFTDAGIDVARPVTTTCGSGVTAAILSLALAEIGAPAHALYDGSWTEWGANPSLPVAKGPA
jgi:thiosulfate/3-mercaptopyruvate sulfurtransferase